MRKGLYWTLKTFFQLISRHFSVKLLVYGAFSLLLLGYFDSVVFKMICLPNLKRRISVVSLSGRGAYRNEVSAPRQIGKIALR